LADLLAVGPVVWDRFNQPRDQVLWYYGSLAHTFARRLPGAQTQLLTDTITAMTVWPGRQSSLKPGGAVVDTSTPVPRSRPSDEGT
jgi:hypothetical protein